VVFLAFHGEPAPAAPGHPAPSHSAPSTLAQAAHLHDAPPPMALALIVLALGSVVAGYVGLPAVLGGGNRFEHFLEPSFHLEAAHEAADHAALEGRLMLVSIAVAVIGILIAAYFFLKNRRAAAAMVERFSGLYRVLTHKYYVDEIYDAAIVQPIRIISEQGLWKVIDARVIDGAVNGTGEAVSAWGEVLRRVQTGSVRAYAVSVFLGVVSILGYYLWR
jgi:NADH-quinone oxidoreductase subunit L